MAKYNIDRGFSLDGKVQRKKGQVVDDLSDKELEFARDKKCVSKFKEDKK